MRRLGDVALALHHITKPTIAKVDGVAVGAGLSLALGCDLVVCSDRARLSMIFSKRGLVARQRRLLAAAPARRHGPGQGDRALRRHVERRGGGGHRPGEPGPAASTSSTPSSTTGRPTLAAGPPLALSMTKTLLHASSMASMEQAVEDEARCQALNFSTQDTAGGAWLPSPRSGSPLFIGR